MNEQVSALADDEIAVEDLAKVITDMQTNIQAVEAWSRYHLIGDLMRGAASLDYSQDSSSDVLSLNFKQNLMRRLELEATVLAPNAALTHDQGVTPLVQKNRKTPVVWSIAASFAAVMMVGWMALHQQVQTGQESAPIEVALNTTSDQSIPSEYLIAHQASAPSASSYYLQSVNYSER
ncbi:hypothetical protein GALL_150860 [mine drainage metagenome]|uniref:Anti sigma-E protein RseA N-terminal domain-containing protein n=1 Tax=mine drainage metagenome TaxID=410659 RepID=A0A1J5SS34_9ZZZZ